MLPRERLEKLATQPKSLLSNTRGIFSLIKAQDYDLFECLCSDKLDRAHPECDIRQKIDTDFASRLEHKVSKNTPLHILDVGSGMLFSSAVRVAELVRRGFKEVHIYLTDPLYDDALQKKTLSGINPKRAQMADAAKTAFHEFNRLMKDCGITPIIGDAQGNSKHIANELKMSKSNNDEPAVHLHIFGDIKQIPSHIIERMNAVLIIDIFPPVSLHTLLGTSRHYLSKEALIFSCKERFFSRDEVIHSLSKTDIEHFIPHTDEKSVSQIKNQWDDIVTKLYPDDVKGNFDAFYAAMFSDTLPANTRAIFDDALKRISTRALEVRTTHGSALNSFDWDDAVDVAGHEAFHHLQNMDQPLPIYSVNPFPFWEKDSPVTSVNAPVDYTIDFKLG